MNLADLRGVLDDLDAPTPRTIRLRRSRGNVGGLPAPHDRGGDEHGEARGPVLHTAPMRFVLSPRR